MFNSLLVRLRPRLTQLRANRLLGNMGWLGSAQMLGRVFRLMTTIVVARTLVPEMFGLAAIVLTTYEVMQVFTRRSTASRLVQVNEDELPALSNTAYWLNWIVSAGTGIIMMLLAWPITWLYGDPALLYPLLIMASGFFLLPFGMVHAALNLRSNRLSIVARSEILQILIDAALTITLALAGLGLWALILPKVLVIPVWIIVHRRAMNWQVPTRFCLNGWRRLTGFAGNVIGTDLLSVFRQHVDFILVGYFLGIEALGVYFFAYNAGLGLSMGVVNAFSTSLYPHLCEVNSNWQALRKRFRSGVIMALLIATPVILLQSTLAPWYVPFVYGEQWLEAGAIEPLILLCLSALTRTLGEAASQLLLSIDRSRQLLQWNLVFSLILTGALLFSTQWGLSGMAGAVLLTHWLLLPLFFIMIWRNVFVSPPPVLATVGAKPD